MEIVEAADELRNLMKPTHFSDFLKQEFDKYHTHRENIHSRGLYTIVFALQRLGARIATTNYDLIVEDVLCLNAMDWADRNHMSFFDSKTPVQDRTVLHLHGIYNRPADVIFGTTDYQRLSNDSPEKGEWRATFEHCLRDMLVKSDARVLFVGCGDTMSDPHFKQLFDFCREIDESRPPRHVHLCTDEKYDIMRKTLPASVEGTPFGTFAGLGAGLKEVFSAIFLPLEEAVQRFAPYRRREMARRRERYQFRQTHFPDGVAYLSPADGLTDDYGEFQEYWHVVENFVWRVRPYSDFNSSTDTHIKELLSGTALDERKNRLVQNRLLQSIRDQAVAPSYSDPTYGHEDLKMQLEDGRVMEDRDDTLAERISSAANTFDEELRRASTSREHSGATIPSHEPFDIATVAPAVRHSAAIAFCEAFKDLPRDAGRRGPLHYLVLNEAIDLLGAIVELQSSPFDINATDSDRMTPLHFAVFLNLPSIVEVLLRSKLVNLTLRDCKNRTPFKMAWRSEYHECMRLLA